MAALRGGVVDAPGEGHDGTALFDRVVGRDERAGGRTGFDAEHAGGEARNDAVAHREGLPVRAPAEGIFRNDGPSRSDDAARESAVLGRVEPVERGADDGDGAAAAEEGAFGGFGVDPPRESGNDAPSRLREAVGEGAGLFAAVRGGPPGADDRDARKGQRRGVAGDVERDGRRGDGFEEDRPVGGVRRQDAERKRPRAGDFGGGIDRLEGFAERGGARPPDAAEPGHFPGSRPQERRRRSERRDRGAHHGAADAGHHVEGDVGFVLGHRGTSPPVPPPSGDAPAKPDATRRRPAAVSPASGPA